MNITYLDSQVATETLQETDCFSESVKPKETKIKKERKENMQTNQEQQTQTETQAPTSTSKRGRKSEGKTCKLVCLITGTSRTAGSGYLGTKPAEFRNQYIGRPALKLLRQGLSVQEVRTQLGQGADLGEINPDVLVNAIRINGKHKGE